MCVRIPFHVVPLVLASLSLGSPAIHVAESASATLPELYGELVDYMESTARQMGGAPSALVVSHEGEILFERYLDGLDGAAPLGPIDPATRFPLFSMTKSYVAALLLILEQESRLTLDDPVYYHVPAFDREAGAADASSPRSVTLAHLASHTSGVTYAEPVWANYPPDLGQAVVTTPPGEVFAYNAQGMFTLQRVIEHITGQPLPQLLADKVLARLGLEETAYFSALPRDDERIQIMPTRAPRLDEDPVAAYSFAPAGGEAGSGLYATARDASRFARVWTERGFLDGELFWRVERQRHVWRHHSTRPTDGGHYGLLWWLFEDEPGYVMSGAGGKMTVISPGTGVAITLLRLPLGATAAAYSFNEDKRSVVRLANRLGALQRDRLVAVSTLLRQMREDYKFEQYFKVALAEISRMPQVGHEATDLIRRGFDEDRFMHAAACHLLRRVSHPDLDEAIAFFRVERNALVYTAIVSAFRDKPDPAQRAARLKGIATANPAAWQQAEAFLRSPAYRSLEAALNDMQAVAQEALRTTYRRAILEAKRSLR